MSIEIDKFVREYFEARPQLEPPAYSSIVGYAIPAPCLHMIESLLSENKRMSDGIEVVKELFADPRLEFVARKKSADHDGHQS